MAQPQLCNILVSTVDFFPTFLDLAGLDSPEWEANSLMPAERA